MPNLFLKMYSIIYLVLLFACPLLPLTIAGETSAVIWTSPTLYNLYSVSMTDANNGWAVGGYGTIIRWDGNGWTNVTSPTSNYLESVFMLSESDGWAVGGFPNEGTIVHWDGSSWKTVACPTPNRLHSVFMVSADNGWAVGDGGTIIDWDGSNWKTVTCPTTNALFSVFMVSANDGWAVGGPGGATGGSGSIIHWDGNSWSNATIASPLFSGPNGWFLKSVFMLNSDNGWAVGCNNWQDPKGAIAHWNGTLWKDVTDPALNVTGWFNEVFMIDDSDGWAVSSMFGVIIHWDGENWSRVTSPTDRSLYGVFMIGSEDGWAVGESGTIIRWNGTQWIPELPIPAFALFPVILLSVIFILIRTKDKIERSARLYCWEPAFRVCR